MDKLLITVDEAAKVLSLSRATVYNLVKNNEIPYLRLPTTSGKPGDIRIPTEALQQWIDQLPNAYNKE